METDMNPSARAIRWPRTTFSPSRTKGTDGLPRCWTRGTTSSGANGNCRIASPLVSSLVSGG
jgi:hypothetical protein